MRNPADLAADLRALWATAPLIVGRPVNPPTTPPPSVLPPLPPLADPLDGSKPIEPTTGPPRSSGSTAGPSKTVPLATPATAEALPPIDSPAAATLTGSPAVRCRDHADRGNWLEAPAANRPGWLRTSCRACGGFVGYRPAAAADKSSNRD